MPAVRWKSFLDASPEREYVALISYLPLKRLWMVPKFWAFTRRVQEQLARSHGLVGYSLSARLFSHEFWTLSVWEDEQALMEFVRRLPHGKAMVALIPHMGQTKFVRWRMRGSEVPPGWEEGLRRLQVG